MRVMSGKVRWLSNCRSKIVRTCKLLGGHSQLKSCRDGPEARGVTGTPGGPNLCTTLRDGVRTRNVNDKSGTSNTFSVLGCMKN